MFNPFLEALLRRDPLPCGRIGDEAGRSARRSPAREPVDGVVTQPPAVRRGDPFEADLGDLDVGEHVARSDAGPAPSLLAAHERQRRGHQSSEKRVTRTAGRGARRRRAGRGRRRASRSSP